MAPTMKPFRKRLLMASTWRLSNKTAKTSMISSRNCKMRMKGDDAVCRAIGLTFKLVIIKFSLLELLILVSPEASSRESSILFRKLNKLIVSSTQQFLFLSALSLFLSLLL